MKTELIYLLSGLVVGIIIGILYSRAMIDNLAKGKCGFLQKIAIPKVFTQKSDVLSKLNATAEELVLLIGKTYDTYGQWLKAKQKIRNNFPVLTMKAPGPPEPLKKKRGGGLKRSRDIIGTHKTQDVDYPMETLKNVIKKKVEVANG